MNKDKKQDAEKTEERKQKRDRILICFAMALPWVLITVAMIIVGYPIFAIPSGVIAAAVIFAALFLWVKEKFKS